MIVILIPTIPGLTDHGGSENGRGEPWQSGAENTSVKPDCKYTANADDGLNANQNSFYLIMDFQKWPDGLTIST